ncbi:POT family MFS transporter [Anaeromyxobacter dehalogenans]|uniref:Amino acid/peptide transporter n=1 Tax=Anaeromyxobacter dehalogenans (strain 2CP-C) TaxID=290397 RepID=Q2IGS8_ANADE|nr:POT family MFS transporter [Anaeromyxobacter dehalogenans]ABC83785.1 Amino acid/peptide transporter [Anaeromyxobacter dehalogenans 2CP-C]
MAECPGMPETATSRFPPSIKFLAWNEAAERFSYYGMASILVLHMVRNLGFAENEAVTAYQVFTGAVYLMPIFGALLADRYWGRYNTILWLSLGYVAGHAVLAVWESAWGLLVGLSLISLGAGGLKPCASAFAGDQIPAEDKGLLARLYDLYYWMINLGSTVSTLVIPLLLDHVSARVAFGVPGVAMAVALLVFWVGRGRYVHVPPARHAPPAAAGPGGSAAGAVLRILAVFAPVTVFWALFFQYGSSWTLQAERMDRHLFGFQIAAGNVQTLDAAMVLTFIPVFAVWVFPALERRGVRVTALRKMAVGMFVTVLSFVAAGAVESALQGGATLHVAWQIPQYVFLVIGEVLVSVTALEFAFSQAPKHLRSVVMGLWYVTISAGSLLTALVAWLNRFQGVAYYAFFAAMMLVAAFVFAAVARWYRPVEAAPSAEAAA